jgi:hypothetical protein
MSDKDEFANLILSLGIFFVILVAFLKASQLSPFPLVIVVMSLMCLWLKFFNVQ